jgi:hypothetical protein
MMCTKAMTGDHLILMILCLFSLGADQAQDIFFVEDPNNTFTGG